jgi:hypothetical protein
LIDGEETFEIDIKNSQPLFLTKVIELNQTIVDKDEFEFYKLLTYGGNFYKFLQDKLHLKDKKTTKDLTYKVLFGKNYQNKYDKLYQSLFPSIYDFIKQFKKQMGDYRSLSYELQRTESEFLFNKVIKEIAINFPNTKLITCHDSLICKISDREKVTNIFNRLLIQEFHMDDKSITIS